MSAKPALSTGPEPFGLVALTRFAMTVGAFGLGIVLTAPACIESRYRPGYPDGAVSDGAVSDGARVDAASFDAAQTDSALDLSGRDAGPDLNMPDLSTPDLSLPDLSKPDLSLPDLSTTPTDDPFDPGSCSGPALSSAQALALLGAASRVKLADATLYRRTRTCSPACGAWSAPVVHHQLLLTYSGGVTTDYKDFTFPTHLIVFPQAGQPKFVIRHESDYRHSATADTRGVVFTVGADPMENTYPVINVWDFAPAPSRYDDLAGKLGDKGQLHVAEHCARIVFPTGMTTEVAALYKY